MLMLSIPRVSLLLFSLASAFTPIPRRVFKAFPTRLSVSTNEFPVESLSPDQALPGESGNVHIPKTGISVSDEIEEANKDRYTTKLIPVEEIPGVAQLVTRPLVTQSMEPLRYLVALSPPQNNTLNDYVMIDVPPFSPQLLGQMQSFMGRKGRLRAILVSNRNAIHYDEAPAVYATRRADVDLWKKALPDVPVFGYRMDVPRDCRFAIEQLLDGYGPFALKEDKGGNFSFIETGRPLTRSPWTEETENEVFGSVKSPGEGANATLLEDAKYSAEAIRKREEGKRILAIYSPGHSCGSLSFVFPEMEVCCSGFTIPCEDSRSNENIGSKSSPGPMLDYRGFITTSQDQDRQMESAKTLINQYSDRFRLVLPSRGNPLLLEGNKEERQEALLGGLSQFELLWEIYQQLGIVDEKD